MTAIPAHATAPIADIEDHLELDHLTRITDRWEVHELGSILWTTGANNIETDRRGSVVVQPMIRLYGIDDHKAVPSQYIGCPCMDLARTAVCDTHPERSFTSTRGTT